MKKINEKGITLIALAIAITILITLAAMISYAGKDTVESARLTKFTTELKIMQYKVNDIYDAWKDGKKITINGSEVDATQLGEELTTVQTQADKVFEELHINQNGYRYFDTALLKTLEVENVDQEFFINIENRSVISKDGLKYKNEWYYILDQLPDSLYNVSYGVNTEKPTFEYIQDKDNPSKITIDKDSIKYNGYISKWYVRYGLVENGTVKTWHETQEMTFFLEESGTYQVKVYNGNIESDPKTITIEGEPETSYVGYYADLDGNPSTAEGIIYADLAVGSGLALGTENEVGEKEIRKWNDNDWSVYQYSKVTSGLKKYNVGEEVASEKFGNYSAPIITEVSGTSGKERFYVMALEDIEGDGSYGTCLWYITEDFHLPSSNPVSESENDFGSGIANTTNWINTEEYRPQVTLSKDLWQLLKDGNNKTKYEKDWFVPSKSEWSAFGDMCYKKMGMTGHYSYDFELFGLFDYYWTSSMPGDSMTYQARFDGGYIDRSTAVMDYAGVRLSTTF